MARQSKRHSEPSNKLRIPFRRRAAQFVIQMHNMQSKIRPLSQQQQQRNAIRPPANADRPGITGRQTQFNLFGRLGHPMI